MDRNSVEYVFWQFPFLVLLKSYELLLEKSNGDEKRLEEIENMMRCISIERDYNGFEDKLVALIEKLCLELDDELDNDIFH